MKKIIIVFAILLFTNHLLAQNWLTDIDAAKKESLRTNKPILLTFCVFSNCFDGPPEMFHWNEPEIQNLLNNYVLLRLDRNANRNTVALYGGRTLPYMYVLDAAGVEIDYRNQQKVTKQAFAKFLEKYTINYTLINKELGKKKDEKTALKLAEAYIKLAADNQEISYNLLEVSENYLKMARKEVGRSDADYQRLRQRLKSMR